MMDERTVVGVERRHTGLKDAEAFLQRAVDRDDDESMWSCGDNSRKQAREEMHTAMLVTSRDVGVKTMNLSGVSGRGVENEKEYLIQLERDYSEWSAAMNARGTVKSFTRAFAEGYRMIEVAKYYGVHPKKAERLIHKGLDVFATIRGYGSKDRIAISATKGQSELVGLIKSFQKRHGVSPTLKELADLKNVSITAIHFMVRRMGNRGLLSFVDGRERSIVLLV